MRIVLFYMLMSLIVGCSSVDQKKDSPSIESDLTNTEQAMMLNREAVDQMEKNNIPQAIKLLNEGLEWDNECGALHNNLGVVYFNQSNYYRAALEFQCAVKLMPNDHEAMNNLGLVYEKASQLDKAIEWYQEALKLEPESTEVMGNYVRARIRNGDKDQDLLEMLKIISINDPRNNWSSWAKKQAALMLIEE